MPRPEVLAPAGDEIGVNTALFAGADAVYFGLDEGLNARARATNIPTARLGEVCDRVHRAGAKAYLTLNTLVFEHELPALEGALRAAATAGIDAVIVQDPAVALLARALAPSMEVHASTQMTISSAEAARFAEALGCTRVVVPRELSVEEIRRFAAGTRLELEAFVHGALCMSWSGQCLTSEAWGGRSANRGQCAQSCRLPYDLVVDGEVRPLGEVRYLLSPLDLAGFRAVPALAEIGVASLKIEGRLKGPAYILTAVRAYQRWLDAIEAGAQGGEGAGAQLQRDLGQMSVAYSRGFSDGFFAGSDHQDLVEGRFPKHRGALLGVVAEVREGAVRVARAGRAGTGGLALGEGHAPTGALASPLPAVAGSSAADARGVPITPPEPVPGVGVGFDLGRPEESEPGGPVFGVQATPDGWWLRFGRPGPDLGAVRPGHRVWLTRDPRLATEAERAAAAPEPEGRLPLALVVNGAAGAPLRVVAECSGQRVEVQSDAPLAPAQGQGLDAALLRDKLGALGGTPFRLVDLDLAALAPGLHLAPSALKALRRAFVDPLLQAVLAARRHRVDPEPVAPKVIAAARALQASSPWLAPAAPELEVLVRTEAQLEAVIAAGLPEVTLDWMEWVGLSRAVERAKAAGLRVNVATVRVHKPGEQGYDRRIAEMAPDGVLVRHWAGLMTFADLPAASRPVIHGDFSLNVTNSVTAHQLLALGAHTLTAAHDLDEAQLHALLDGFPAERMVVVAHHHIATFHTEHCVYAHTLSHGRDFKSCGRPCETHRVALRDTQGRAHPVVVDVGCRNTVFNAEAQSAAAAIPRLVARGVRRFRVELVWEDRAETARVLAAWRGLLAGAHGPSEVHAQLRVHEQFGVTSGTMRAWS